MRKIGAFLLVAVWAILVVGWAAMMPGGAHAQGGDELIHNGDFEQNMEFWTMAETCSGCWMGVEGDAVSGRSRLAWERTGSGNNGAAVSARQTVNADVSGYARLLLQLELAVNAHTLLNSGWWSDSHAGTGEYPVKVTLRFLDTAGQPFEWTYGFLSQHDGSTQLKNFMLVSAGQSTQVLFDVFSPVQWVDTQGNPLPRPAVLTDVLIGGSGWDFAGFVDTIKMTGEVDVTSGGDQSGGSDQSGGDQAGGGDQSGGALTGCQSGYALVVEDYPLVSAAEDRPDHFEFRQRLPGPVLDLRRAWREPDASSLIAAPNDVIAPWGYSLDPNGDYFSLNIGGLELIPDVTHVWPIAVNASGHGFSAGAGCHVRARDAARRAGHGRQCEYRDVGLYRAGLCGRRSGRGRRQLGQRPVRRGARRAGGVHRHS